MSVLERQLRVRYPSWRGLLLVLVSLSVGLTRKMIRRIVEHSAGSNTVNETVD